MPIQHCMYPLRLRLLRQRWHLRPLPRKLLHLHLTHHLHRLRILIFPLKPFLHILLDRDDRLPILYHKYYLS